MVEVRTGIESAASKHCRLSAAMLLAFAVYAGLVTLSCSLFVGFFIGIIEISPQRTTEVFRSMRFHGGVAVATAVIALALRRRQECNQYIPRIVLSAIVVLVVASFDGILGVVYPRPSEVELVLRPHATRGWSHRRGAVGTCTGINVSINSLGLRGPEVRLRKASDEYRILFVGDSVTFGHQLSHDDTFVARVQTLLHSRAFPKRIITLNAGVVGYATWQEFDYLQQEGIMLDPDLVVLGFCPNDMIDLIGVAPGLISGPVQSFQELTVPHWSGLVRAVLRAVDSYSERTIARQQVWANNDLFSWDQFDIAGLDDIFRDPPPPVVAAAWQRALDDLDRVRSFCQENELAWILVYFPYARQLSTVGWDLEPQRYLLEWSQRHGILFLDMTTFLRQQRDPSPLTDYVHLSATGSALAAARIVGFLEENELLPK